MGDDRTIRRHYRTTKSICLFTYRQLEYSTASHQRFQPLTCAHHSFSGTGHVPRNALRNAPPRRAKPALRRPREAIGRGASEAVYRAWDSFAQREVAIKVAHAAFSKTARANLIRKAWLNEVHMAGNATPTSSKSMTQALARTVPTLSWNTCRTERWTPTPGQPAARRQVLEIAYKCASALDYACRAGVIHRDI